ncbi:Down syndrome cell adhesion molecule-like protein 1 [Nymphon striatum]|nr:Down syndrome cell adhesion molecule-like protein 1 [Nymphon striatum]KAG1695535.1 Down syndrome cell adhesion molecule-like protein 1 [Nymphon striatum]KAG1695536.1 Down syndrome cell adhesion molecule-like protein 1 [Nymphon striatum]KAG1695539.1 Down syndrome cell adhesion molecule-like protein 1 [Nymphon striatum]
MFKDGRLQIRDVNDADNNMAYWCKTKHNLSGDIQISVTPGNLRVSEPKNSVAPRLTHSVSEIEAMDEKGVELPCSAQGWPIPHYNTLMTLSMDKVQFFKEAEEKVGPSADCNSFRLASFNLESVELVAFAAVTAIRECILALLANAHFSKTICFKSVPSFDCDSIRWFRQEKNKSFELMNSNKYMQVGGSLFITKVGRKDIGTYLCKVSNNVGTTSATTNLYLKDQLSVYIDPQHLEVDAGKSANLTCLVTTTRPYEVKWLKDGRVISTSESSEFSLSEQPYSLFIASVQRHSEGMYQCHVKSNSKEVQGTAEIILGSDSPIFMKTFKNHLKKPGDTLSLECSATGSPKPIIRWKLNEATQRQSSRIQIRNENSNIKETKSTLTIDKVRTEDGGNYTCVASNKAGSVLYSMKIDVYGPPAVRPMTNLSVISGADIFINCYTYGYPIQDISWSRVQKIANSYGSILIETSAYGLTKVKERLDKRCKICDYANISATEYNNLLRKFYAEVKAINKTKV